MNEQSAVSSTFELEVNSPLSLNTSATEIIQDQVTTSVESNQDNSHVQSTECHIDQLVSADNACTEMDEQKNKVEVEEQEDEKYFSKKESSGPSLSDYKEATLKLLNDLSSDVNTIPETDYTTDDDRRTLPGSSDGLAISEPVIVTIPSDSSTEHSRSSNKDDNDITVDLTNEPEDSKECAIETSSLISSIGYHVSGGPAAKRQKMDSTPVAVDLTGDKDDSNASSDVVVVVPETEETTPAKDTEMENFLRFISIQCFSVFFISASGVPVNLKLMSLNFLLWMLIYKIND